MCCDEARDSDPKNLVFSRLSTRLETMIDLQGKRGRKDMTKMCKKKNRKNRNSKKEREREHRRREKKKTDRIVSVCMREMMRDSINKILMREETATSSLIFWFSFER